MSEIWDTVKKEELEENAYFEKSELKVMKWRQIDKHGLDVGDTEIKEKPDAVTKELAQAVWDNWSVDVSDFDIKVVEEVKE